MTRFSSRAVDAGSGGGVAGARPRGGVSVLSRAFPALVLAFALGMAPAGPLTFAQDRMEVTWSQVYVSQQVEVAVNQEIDLDYNDRAQSDNDMGYETGEDGSLAWGTRRGATAALAGPGDFASFDMGLVDRLGLSGKAIVLFQNGAPAVTPGTIIVVGTNSGHYAKVSIDEAGGTLKFHWVTYEKHVARIAAAASTLQAPVLKIPPLDFQFEHVPRDLQLVWGTVAGAASYTVELDCKGCCPPRYDLHCAEQEGSKGPLLTLSATQPELLTTFNGAHPGRWRVRAVGKDGKPGPWSAYSTFTFTK